MVHNRSYMPREQFSGFPNNEIPFTPEEVSYPEVESEWFKQLPLEHQKALADIDNRYNLGLGEWIDDEADLQEEILEQTNAYIIAGDPAQRKSIEGNIVHAFNG
jgi:hypothetical protein